MARLFLIILLALPLIEIALMIWVGQMIGLWPVLGLLVGAAVLGALLIRWQGVTVIARMRQNLMQGVMPTQALADTMMIGLAGLLLIVPGFISDVAAIALLVAPLRSVLYGAAARRVVVVDPQRPPPPPGEPPEVIDLDPERYREDEKR